MRGITAALGALLIVSGCGSNTEPVASPPPPSSSSSVAAAPTSTVRPPTPLQADGFGAVRPTTTQLIEFGDWLSGPGKGARAATDQAAAGLSDFTQAANDQDVSALKGACRRLAEPLTLRLPASLPTPDPDTTTVMNWLVEDAGKVSQACTALTDPPTGDQLDAVQTGVERLADDMDTAGTIMSRNGDLLRAESQR